MNIHMTIGEIQKSLGHVMRLTVVACQKAIVGPRRLQCFRVKMSLLSNSPHCIRYAGLSFWGDRDRNPVDSLDNRCQVSIVTMDARCCNTSAE